MSLKLRYLLPTFWLQGKKTVRKSSDQFIYKAFISYSHAADGKLAPALQTGLHRFAKPWYRLRAMRVFRDETTLSTSPELWTSIETALKKSEYFIFLASPEAAQSFWVRKEFEFWMNNAKKDMLLIILTDGEIIWDRNMVDFDWSKTTAIPHKVQHGLRDEPLYLDLRWAKTRDDLSLKNITFRSSIADIASTLLGRSKDELIGEDVRRHKQTRRITFTAISALVILTGLSIMAAIVAVQKQREAIRQQNIAIERGAIAQSRQLAAQANSLAGSESGDLALLLSLEALKSWPTVDARNGLLSALTRDPHRLFHLHGHMGEVNSIAFSSDSKELLSLGCEGIGTLGLCKFFGIRRWDLDHGNPLSQVILNGATRFSILTRRGKNTPLIAYDKRAGEWDPITGMATVISNKKGITSPDGKLRVEVLHSKIVVSSLDSSNRRKVSLKLKDNTIRTIAFNPDSTLLAVGGSKGRMELWDTNTLFDGVPMPLRSMIAHTKAVTALNFSPDGKSLVSGSWDGSVLVWDLNAKMAPNKLIEGISFSSATFSQNGHWFVVALSKGESGGEIQLWDVEHWKLNKTLAGKAPIAISPDNRLLAVTGANGSIIVRDLNQHAPLARTLEDPGEPQSLAFLDDGGLLVAGGQDQTLRMWNTENGKIVFPPIDTQQGPVTALASHPDGKTLASGGKDGRILLWNMKDNVVEPIEELTGHHSPVFGLDFSHDGHRLVSASFDDTIRIWKAGEVNQYKSNPPIDTWEDIYAVKFDSTASRIAAASEGGSVLIWDLIEDSAKARVVGNHLLNSDGMSGLSFSPNDSFIITSSFEQTQLWGLKPEESSVKPPLKGSFVDLDSTGKLAANVTDNDEIQLIDVDAWRVFDSVLGSHQRFVNAMIFSPDGRLLASAADDEVTLWNVDLEDWKKRACDIAKRNFTEEEWERYLGDKPYTITCSDAKEPPEITLDAERSLGLAIRAYKLGKTIEASQYFAKAANMAAVGENAEVANRICWNGSIRGANREVMVVCDRAVELSPTKVGYRDSRGIARALSGNVVGAIEDFQVYVDSNAQIKKLTNRRALRKKWIEALKAGSNPFDSMELHRIRHEGFSK